MLPSTAYTCRTSGKELCLLLVKLPQRPSVLCLYAHPVSFGKKSVLEGASHTHELRWHRTVEYDAPDFLLSINKTVVAEEGSDSDAGFRHFSIWGRAS
jgi:hypothetical protein